MMRSQELLDAPESEEPGPGPAHVLYQPCSTEEDRRRTNRHYDQPAVFFNRITGGEWNVYSANLWENARTDTESQEAKLDLLARLMELKPGQRIMDVGCGWAGPLVYLSKKYGVRCVGLTLSPLQKEDADQRIARYGADVRVVVSHWRDYEDDEGFDAVYTDEVIVHFNDLRGFFAKVHSLLRSGGRMLNKEVHFTHSRYYRIPRAMVPVNEIFGVTCNYRTLAQELALLDETNFESRVIYQIPNWNYVKTIDRWQANMHLHRDELVALVGEEHYLRFRRYLKLARLMVGSSRGTLDCVVAHKIEPDGQADLES
jgi:cyclopropane-fatty-acyl-phospholipid synthase